MKDWAKKTAVALQVAVVYAVMARLGFFLAISPGNITAVWPASGVAVASNLLYGLPALVGVWIGSFIINTWFYTQSGELTVPELVTAFVIACGSSLQTFVVSYWLTRRIKTDEMVSQPRDAVLFISIAFLCSFIASTFGVTGNVIAGIIPVSNFFNAWITWWAGDLGGILVYTPLIIVWSKLPQFFQNKRRSAEFLALVIALLGFCYLIFEGPLGQHHYPLLFGVFPFLIWAAGRFGLWGVTMVIPIVEVCAISGLKHGTGPLALNTHNESLLVLASFMAVTALVGLTFACVLTQWQRVRKELEGAASELESKVFERTAELKQANEELLIARDRAIESSNIKSAFVANISHELRTPLGGIIGANELLLTRQHNDEVRALLEMMHDSGHALLQVVNDILDLSKIEAGKVALENEPFAPGFLVQDAAKLLAPAAASKKLRLEVTLDQQVPPFVFGDLARVRQILLNLIGNAVKFTEAGSVSVRLEAVEPSAAGPDDIVVLKFSVRDTGIGIAEADIPLLFQPFSQVDSSLTRKFGGTGLGLAISKRFVEMMSGEIGCLSEPGKGSTFWFRVPFDAKRKLVPADSEQSGRLIVEPIEAELKNASILVVEDHPTLRDLALRQIAALGMAAVAVENGRQAVEHAQTGKYRIILMDVNLPDLSGAEATRQIRASEATSGKPPLTIIAMTAGAMSGDREKAHQAGMDDYIAKPVSLEQLRAILQKWLAKSSRTV